MEMKTRLLSLPLLLMLVASLAACGGGSSSVPATAIAVVNSEPIPTATFNTYFQQALEIAKLNAGGVEPALGSPQYTQVKDQTVAYLVRITELEQQAKEENISVSDAEVTTYLENIAKDKPYNGSMAKLEAALKKTGLTMETARDEVYINLLADKIHKKVTETVKVTSRQAKVYYTTHMSDYTTPASTTRNIQYILFQCAVPPSTACPHAKNVAKKKIADMVEQKLRNGASFAAMAKQYSDDSSTASKGGKLCIAKSQQVGTCIPTVPAFSDAGFALKTGETSQPVDATSSENKGYGWFIVKALGAVKSTPAHTTTFKDAEASIKQSISQVESDQLWSQWLDDLAKKYEGKVSYQASYVPPPTTTTATAPTP